MTSVEKKAAEPTRGAGRSGEEPPERLTALETWLLSQTSAHGHRLLSDALAAEGFRGYDYRLLAALVEYGPASQAVLGRRTGIDRSDVAASLSDLSGRELVRRAPDPEDRRRNIVTLTESGAELVERLDHLLAEVQNELLAPLDPEERAQFVRLLNRILEHHRG